MSTMIDAEKLAQAVDRFISQQDDRDDSAYGVLIEFQEFVFPELRALRIRKEAMSKLTAEEIEVLRLNIDGKKA